MIQNFKKGIGEIRDVKVLANLHANSRNKCVSVIVSFIHSNQCDVGTWGTMHELAITYMYTQKSYKHAHYLTILFNYRPGVMTWWV